MCADKLWVSIKSDWWFGTFFIFPFSWECHHPNWRTPSFFRGVGSTTNQNVLRVCLFYKLGSQSVSLPSDPPNLSDLLREVKMTYPFYLNLYQLPFQEPKLEVPTIYKAYVREYPHKIWPYMVRYLHFRILDFPLIIYMLVYREFQICKFM